MHLFRTPLCCGPSLVLIHQSHHILLLPSGVCLTVLGSTHLGRWVQAETAVGSRFRRPSSDKCHCLPFGPISDTHCEDGDNPSNQAIRALVEESVAVLLDIFHKFPHNPMVELALEPPVRCSLLGYLNSSSKRQPPISKEYIGI